VDPETLPFSSAELTQALLARLFPADDGADAPGFRIAPAGAGTVTVQIGDRSRVVAIGDRSGPAAARVIALVIAELLSGAGAEAAPDEGAEAQAAPTATVLRAAGEPPGRFDGTAPAVPTAPGATSAMSDRSVVPRLSVAGGASKGTGSEELLAGTLDADVVLPIGGGWARLAPSAGLTVMPSRNVGSFNEVSFRAGAARLLAGGSWGPFDLLGGPFVTAYSIGGATEHSGFLFGGEVLARVSTPVSRRFRVFAAARADAYANRVRVVWTVDNGYATPRLGLAIAVGFAWDWAS
jgi:hypothetical protein